MPLKKQSFLYRNGLSVAVISLMIIFLFAQFVAGRKEKNKQLAEDGNPELTPVEYLQSGHFMQATFENWESEFLQMALYVLFTVSLRQKGSSESKKLDGEGEEEVDREPRPHRDAPWPVKRGGWWLRIYQNSLSIAFMLLFLFSFLLHFVGSLKEQNDENLSRNLSPEAWQDYITDTRFWFESFQNWQSEFLSVASIVLLSIWLRQKGSPESKPVDAPYAQTGD